MGRGGKHIVLIYTVTKSKYLSFGKIQRLFRPSNAARWSSIKLILVVTAKEMCQLAEW